MQLMSMTFSFLTALTPWERLKSPPLLWESWVCENYNNGIFNLQKRAPIINDTNRIKTENIRICSFIKYAFIFYPFEFLSGFLDCLMSFQNCKKRFFSNELCILCFMFKCFFCYCAFTSVVQFYPVPLNLTVYSAS